MLGRLTASSYLGHYDIFDIYLFFFFDFHDLYIQKIYYFSKYHLYFFHSIYSTSIYFYKRPNKILDYLFSFQNLYRIFYIPYMNPHCIVILHIYTVRVHFQTS